MILIAISLDRHHRGVAHPEWELRIAIFQHDSHREPL
jgi:hypothetical protein